MLWPSIFLGISRTAILSEYLKLEEKSGFKGALSRYSVIFAPFCCVENNGGRAIFHGRSASHDPSLRGSIRCRLFGTRWSDVQCDFCGLHAVIDPASPAVVEASVYYGVDLPFCLSHSLSQ